MNDPLFGPSPEDPDHENKRKSVREMKRQAARVAVNSPRIDDVKRANGCQCCARPASGFRSLSALEFHHAGEFRFNIARRKYRAWEELVREMMETVLLCHRCHGRLHAELVSIAPNLRVTIPAFLMSEMVGGADDQQESMPDTNSGQSGARELENRS